MLLGIKTKSPTKVIIPLFLTPEQSGVFHLVNNMNLNRGTARQFYNSHAWIRCKEMYLAKANHLCERCLIKGRYEPAYIVHHKIYLTDENFGKPELMFGFDNLEALCLSCHNEEHMTKREGKRWKFVDGELITRS